MSVQNNTAPFAVINSIEGKSSEITIRYTVTDLEFDTASVSLFYSGYATGDEFVELTHVTGDTNEISTGVLNTLTWSSNDDFRNNEYNARLKLIPHDASGSGEEIITEVFEVLNNDRPETEIVSVIGDSSEIRINYVLNDDEDDPCDIILRVSTDGGETFETTDFSGDKTGVINGNHEIIWNSYSMINSNNDNVVLKITGQDSEGEGDGINSEIISILNNNPPRASINSENERGSGLRCAKKRDCYCWLKSSSDKG